MTLPGAGRTRRRTGECWGCGKLAERAVCKPGAGTERCIGDGDSMRFYPRVDAAFDSAITSVVKFAA